MRLAYESATKSPDPSTQNGAVLMDMRFDNVNLDDNRNNVFVTSCNTFPYGVEDKPERLVRPMKYSYIEHAERNALYAGANKRMCLDQCTLFVPWFACADCARAIIQMGVRHVVGHNKMFEDTPDHWKDSIEAAFNMFDEAGVKTELLEGPVPHAPDILFNEKLWSPSAS